MRRNLCALMALGVSIALVACNNDSKGTPETAPTYAVRGIVRDLNGAPLKNAAVVAKKATATTDAEGRYQLKLPEGDAVVRFAKAGYVDTLKKVSVSKDYPTMLHVNLLGAAKAQKLDASTGGLITGTGNANGTVSVEIPQSAFVDAKGQRVTDEVSVRLTNIDVSTDPVREAAPGSFIGDDKGNTVQIESGGMLALEVRDTSGQKVQVADNAKLTVKFPVNEGLQNPPETMSLWSFDEQAGQWALEGTSTLDNDKQYYTAELPHMSTWNCDQPLSATCVRGCAKDKDTGAPLAGAQVVASGIDYVGNSQATTGPDGCFKVAVKKSSKVRITVQHKLGGGTSREFDGAGDSDTPVPPAIATVCADAGEFDVEKDVFNYDGEATDCTSVMASIRGKECQEEMGAMFSCLRIAGGCTYSVGSSESVGMSMRWDSGARMVTSMGGLGSSVTMTGYDPDGQMCFSMDMSSSQTSGDNVSATYSDAKGNKYKITVNGNVTTVECPNGKKFEMTGEDSAAMSACRSQQNQSQAACTVEGLCQSKGDCGPSEICCGTGTYGMCYETVCPTGTTPLN